MHTLITHARRGISDPGTEIARNTWDMGLFGHRGNLSFTAITQPWLRKTAKIWALADLPRRRGRSGGDKTRHYLSSLAFLSASLRQRADHGEDPATLGRQDIELFLNRLGYLHAAGKISELTRVPGCREVRKLLTSARQLGATRPGGPAAGLSDQFALHRDDMPDEPEDVVALPLDCLASDPGGAAVLDETVLTRPGGQQRCTEAVDVQQMAINAATDPRQRGWLKQQPAAYLHSVKSVRAQKQQVNALDDNPNSGHGRASRMCLKGRAGE